MAKTKSITVSLHRKVSDDNYGSYGAEVTQQVELEEGDKASKVIQKVSAALEEEMTGILEKIKPKAKKSK